MALGSTWPSSLENDDVRFLADAIPGPLSYLDASLRYRFVNANYETLLSKHGRTDRTGIIGKTLDEAWGEELAAIIRPNLQRALTGETLTVEVGFDTSRSLNSYIPHVVDGEVRGVLLVAQDITKLAASRAALIQAERMASIGRLIAGLLHELNTPVGVVRSTMAALNGGLQKLHAADEARRQKITAQLIALAEGGLEAGERISTLTERLERFARLDGATTDAVDLRPEIDDVIGLLEDQLGTRIRVVRDYAAIPPVPCRPAEINQVLMALVSNAISAIEGEGTLTITTTADEDGVEVAVEDTGVGIAAERLSTIFEPAFAEAGRRVRSGVGLFLSKSIAEQHGGSLQVQSTLGRGSRFLLRLPAEPASRE